jgi:hypothetical protein
MIEMQLSMLGWKIINQPNANYLHNQERKKLNNEEANMAL